MNIIWQNTNKLKHLIGTIGQFIFVGDCFGQVAAEWMNCELILMRSCDWVAYGFWSKSSFMSGDLECYVHLIVEFLYFPYLLIAQKYGLQFPVSQWVVNLGFRCSVFVSACNLEGLQDSGDPVRLGQKEPFRTQMYTGYKVNAVTTANWTKQRLLGKDRVQL